MSPPAKPQPRAAEPNYSPAFDPWNSSSTGHQRAENKLGGSTGWRDSRTSKLHSQFRSGADGGKRMSDRVGAGSADWDPRAKALIAPEVRERARSSVMDMLAQPGTMLKRSMSAGTPGAMGDGEVMEEHLTGEEAVMAGRKAEDDAREAERGRPRKLFEGVVVYVNGSTHPLISDHKLKHVLAENGGRVSIHLGRRQVTHVVLGRPASAGGAGGGLAGGKLQREIQKVGGCGVKFVGVEWVLESIKAGKRLPEARFSNLKTASKRQESVYGLYSQPTPTASDQEPPPSGQR